MGTHGLRNNRTSYKWLAFFISLLVIGLYHQSASAIDNLGSWQNVAGATVNQGPRYFQPRIGFYTDNTISLNGATPTGSLRIAVTASNFLVSNPTNVDEGVPVFMLNSANDTTRIEFRPRRTQLSYTAVLQEFVEATGSTPVGMITEDILRGGSPSGSDRGVESAASNLIADAQKWSTSFNGAEIAFMNPGGVRSDLTYAQSDGEGEGVVTLGEAFTFQPFGNTLQTFPMTGAQIVSVLEDQCQPTGASRPVLHLGVSDGFTYDLEVDIVARDCINVTVSNVMLDGFDLDLGGTYMVTVNSFLADGGDNFITFREIDPSTHIDGGSDLEALVHYLGTFSPIDPPSTDRVNELAPSTTEITVTNPADSGAGSLRQALMDIDSGGTIDFDPVLAGGVIRLTSGQLGIDRNVTIDASAAPELVVSGNLSSRVFEISAGVIVSMNDLEVADGTGASQGGGILNNGTLNLHRVVVRDNTEISAGPANFMFGGGGIYNGDGAKLNLTDSTVADNVSVNHPGGGIYGYFNSEVNIEASTIAGNIGGDVAGGLRTLGNLSVLNSTISGNVSTAWHGGAAFMTDGVVTIVNSTITDNIAPAGTAGGLMVASFGAPVSVTVTNSIVANNGSYDCQSEGGGAASLESGGNNVFADTSCSSVAEDIVGVDPQLSPLADNGGPTLTHAPAPSSPAIDAANLADCPAIDQRGASRPQGAGCDTGAYELQP